MEILPISLAPAQFKIHTLTLLFDMNIHIKCDQQKIHADELRRLFQCASTVEIL